MGEAENLSRLCQLIADKHLEKNIEFAGYHTDVTPFYENSDVIDDDDIGNGKFFDGARREQIAWGSDCHV